MGIVGRIVAAALAGLAAVGTCGPARADKRVALVIGNSTYVNVSRLGNPANDASLMAETLHGLGFTLIGNGPQIDLDKTHLDRAVQSFGNQLQGADVGLFYYAGHGVQVRGANFLVPVDANPTRESDLDFQMLDTGVVLRQMENSGARLNIVILDACRNNPFGGRGLRATTAGLAQMQAPQGTLISYATQPGAVAQDGDGRNSPYTLALAQTMRRPGLDIFRMFNEVGAAVSSATGGAQQPWVSLSPIQGEFYFAVPAGIAAQDGNGETDFSHAQQSNTREAWLAFLRLHPTGLLAERARDKLALLTPPPPPAPTDNQSAKPGAPQTLPTPQGSTTDQQSQFAYSSWRKVCAADGAARICLTVKDARVQGGTSVVTAALIESGSKRVLRVTWPLGVQLAPGTRAIVDQNTPMTAPYAGCGTAGCVADYEVAADLIGKLKKGQTLTVQAINANGQAASIPLPLAEFAQAYDWPALDPQALDAQQQAALQSPTAPSSLAADQLGQMQYSPWTKFCMKGNDGKNTCFTGKDGRNEAGIPVVAAVIIGAEGAANKIMRVTVPLGVQNGPGTRAILDQDPPLLAPYVICFANGCMSDYEASANFIDRMQKGRTLTVQAIMANGQPTSLVLPLDDFAKAFNGPPTDPKEFEAQQKKLQEELQRRADQRWKSGAQ